jgi:flagellar motor switch protein FliG
LSELVDFEDLGDLDGNDLQAVVDQVAPEQFLDALAGLPQERRRLLLAKLPADSAADFETKAVARGTVPSLAAHEAQRAVVEALCRLSRAGQVAFSDPDDFD